MHRWYLMAPASAQLMVRPERKDGGHPALCHATPQWPRMRHQSHQSHQMNCKKLPMKPTVSVLQCRLQLPMSPAPELAVVFSNRRYGSLWVLGWEGPRKGFGFWFLGLNPTFPFCDTTTSSRCTLLSLYTWKQESKQPRFDQVFTQP